MTLRDELLPAGDEEAISELINEYVLNKDEYLVNGAILTCNMAFTKSQVLRNVLYGSKIKMLFIRKRYKKGPHRWNE